MEVRIRKGKREIAAAKYCSSLPLKALGLMFSRPLKKNKGILLVNSFESIELSAIHMLFVFYPIDVVWMDKEKQVVGIKRNARPFALRHAPKKDAKYILELRKGGAKGIREGDRLAF
ncbi:MAG: DUF192 domain-containing protein [Candidatus Woesearchaeota archaeon]